MCYSDTTVYESIESLEKKFVRVTSSASVRNVCDFIRKKLSLHEDKQVCLQFFESLPVKMISHFNILTDMCNKAK